MNWCCITILKLVCHLFFGYFSHFHSHSLSVCMFMSPIDGCVVVYLYNYSYIYQWIILSVFPFKMKCTNIWFAKKTVTSHEMWNIFSYTFKLWDIWSSSVCAKHSVGIIANKWNWYFFFSCWFLFDRCSIFWENVKKNGNNNKSLLSNRIKVKCVRS